MPNRVSNRANLEAEPHPCWPLPCRHDIKKMRCGSLALLLETYENPAEGRSCNRFAQQVRHIDRNVSDVNEKGKASMRRPMVDDFATALAKTGPGRALEMENTNNYNK